MPNDENLISLPWSGILRLQATSDEISVLGSHEHTMIGLRVPANVSSALDPIPIELAITARAAAGLLAMLLDLQAEGLIPKEPIQTTKNTHH
jgi:hypothetical protein